MGPGVSGAPRRACARRSAVLPGGEVRSDVPGTPSEAWPHPEQTLLGRIGGERLQDASGRSGFVLIPSGLEAFGMRAALAATAERTLDLQYYIVRDDATSNVLLLRVRQAADRGVRVRLLLDDMYAAGRDADLAALSAHPAVEVRVVNPFLSRGPFWIARLFEFLGTGGRLNRRMHNKLWIADNAVAVIGGRNLGDEYFDAHGEVNFTDLNVLAIGPAVRDVSKSFDEYWNSPWSVPIEALVTSPGIAAQPVGPPVRR